jgi:hypothetical protein
MRSRLLSLARPVGRRACRATHSASRRPRVESTPSQMLRRGEGPARSGPRHPTVCNTLEAPLSGQITPQSCKRLRPRQRRAAIRRGPKHVFVDFEAVKRARGSERGESEWVLMSQERIDRPGGSPTPAAPVVKAALRAGPLTGAADRAPLTPRGGIASRR